MDKAVIGKVFIIFITFLTSCVGSVYDGVSPYPYSPVGDYPAPDIVSFPNFNQVYKNGSNHISSLQFNNMINMNQQKNASKLEIAYQSTANRKIEDLVALVTVNVGIGFSICSATPIKYDSSLDKTVLVTAAHCLIKSKPDLNNLYQNDIYPLASINVIQGINAMVDPVNIFKVDAVFVYSKYCDGSSFYNNGSCPNLIYKAGTEGNDVALLEIKGKFGNPEHYPKIATLDHFPAVYTKAPVLSLGYGVVNGEGNQEIVPDGGVKAFATTNYLYASSDHVGYHYLHNSIFNEEHKAYAILFCSGDSGGPDLFWDGNQWLMLAIHTYGPANQCGGFTKNLYRNGNGSTNLGFYFTWLQSIIDNLDNHGYCDNSDHQCLLKK